MANRFVDYYWYYGLDRSADVSETIKRLELLANNSLALSAQLGIPGAIKTNLITAEITKVVQARLLFQDDAKREAYNREYDLRRRIAEEIAPLYDIPATEIDLASDAITKRAARNGQREDRETGGRRGTTVVSHGIQNETTSNTGLYEEFPFPQSIFLSVRDKRLLYALTVVYQLRKSEIPPAGLVITIPNDTKSPHDFARIVIDVNNAGPEILFNLSEIAVAKRRSQTAAEQTNWIPMPELLPYQLKKHTGETFPRLLSTHYDNISAIAFAMKPRISEPDDIPLPERLEMLNDFATANRLRDGNGHTTYAPKGYFQEIPYVSLPTTLLRTGKSIKTNLPDGNKLRVPEFRFPHVQPEGHIQVPGIVHISGERGK